MTAPDTKAIRAQMEALEGFTPGPWYQANGSEIHDRSVMFGESGERLGSTPMLIAEAYDPREEGNARLIAAAPDMRETILDLCDAMDELRAGNERLQTIIGNLHTVEGKHRETANAHFHRANRLQAENDHLRNFIVDFSETKFDRIDRRSPDPQDDLDPLTDYLAIEAWQEDARAALAQKEGK